MDTQGVWRAGVVAKVSRRTRRKVIEVAMNVKKVGEDDPRRIVHSLKVGLALTLVSLLYYFRPLYDGFGVNAMWAVLTVVVVFEYTVGGTLGKGLNRAFATLLAGGLAIGVNHLASLSGERGEPIVLGASVFLLATASTFARFFPLIKARYDYGVVIFILTFSLVTVSGYRVGELMKLAHQRVSTIAIGSFACVFISMFVCPVWAGEDLHEQVARNIEKLASFLEGFGAEYFTSVEGETSQIEKEEKRTSHGYKTLLNSKSSEETLANFARWEPGHGYFRFGHPWKKYLEIGSLIRRSAYSIESLNGCIASQTQVQVDLQQEIQAPCTKMTTECAKTLIELSSAIRTMTKPISASHHLEILKSSVIELKTTIINVASLEHTPLSKILSTATIVSLLIDIAGHTEKLVQSVNELAKEVKFKDVPKVERTPSLCRAAVQPLSDQDCPHVFVDISRLISDSAIGANVGETPGHVNR